MEWCGKHRLHHKYTDEEGDPYNITNGFWYAHWLWIFYKNSEEQDEEIHAITKDIQRCNLCRWQQKYYLFIAISVGILLPTLIASYWGDALGGLFIAACLRVVVFFHIVECVNSVCHYFGSRPYTTKHTARNNTLVSIFTLGEGYHNYHHAFPYDYRNGVKWYEFDPTKWFIKLLYWLGLAKNLRSASNAQIAAKKEEV